VSELNFRDAMCCLGGSDQALQPDALGISLVSRPKRYEVGSLRVDMGNPNLIPHPVHTIDIDTLTRSFRLSTELERPKNLEEK